MESVVTYKCPNCEAGLTFDAGKQKFVCEFCLSDFTEEELLSDENKQREEERAKADREFDSGIKEYFCSSCGAEIITDESTVASECYYCHNPVVLSDKVSGGLRPNKIIPFKFDKAEAKDVFLRYAKKKKFAPSDYFSDVNADKITGIYYPFWVVDADTEADLDASAKRIRTWSMGGYAYTETSRFAILRSGDIHFEDIVMSAISEEDKKMLEGILPYPSDSHIDFSIPYLQGFAAKKRNIEREALSAEARERMDSYARTILLDTVRGYNSVSGERLNMRVHKSHWEYTLMPVWILNYKRGKKNYTYAMNGNTGKLYGELPVSPLKLLLTSGAIMLAVTAIITLLSWFLF